MSQQCDSKKPSSYGALAFFILIFMGIFGLIWQNRVLSAIQEQNQQIVDQLQQQLTFMKNELVKPREVKK